MVECQGRLPTSFQNAAFGVGPLIAVVIVLVDLSVPAGLVQHVHRNGRLALEVGKVSVRFFLVIGHYAVFQFAVFAMLRCRV